MGRQPVKNNLIMTLEVIKRHSDVDHRLTQKNIQEYLQTDFELTCDRKTVKRNLMNLIEFGFDIEYTEIERKNGSQKSADDVNVIITDIYYNHTLEPSEVKLISDGLLFSRYVTGRETERLISKIEKQSSPFAKNRIKGSVNYETIGHTENAQVLYTVELLNQAIEEKKQIEFLYCEYGTDKKLHPKKTDKYIINPYYTVTANGRYYLICNVDKYDNIANFRVDKILEIQLIDMPQKDIRKTAGNSHGFDLSKYMKDHIYMFSGETVNAELEIDRFLIGQIIDWFGKGFNVLSESNDKCVISLKVNENALFYWTMQYSQFVKIIKPQSVADRVVSVARDIILKYGEE